MDVKIIKSEKTWMESNAIDQLNKTAQLEGMIHAVGFPDLHMGKIPVGAAFISEDVIYPHIIGNDIGCGMALFTTGIKKTKFKVDKAMKKLQDVREVNNINIDHLLRNVKFEYMNKMGTIGSGNHFGEFQEIDKVYNQEQLESIGIDKSHIYLLVHSGSRKYGESILRKYLDAYNCQNGLKVGEPGFEAYMNDHEKAINYGRLNRVCIAYKLSSAIGCKENVRVLDSIHNGISEKVLNGRRIYVHRKGAAQASEQYVVVAGSRGSASYIVKILKNDFEYGFSIAHGAGRKWSRSGCREKLESIYLRKELRDNAFGKNLICNNRNLVYEEAHEAYKDIARVIEDMKEEGLIEIVATLKPMITYKG